MKFNAAKYSLLYYSIVAITAAVLLLLVFKGLAWPVTAEIILGITLVLHSLVLAKTAKEMFVSAYRKGLVHDLIFHLQHGYDISDSKSESEI